MGGLSLLQQELDLRRIRSLREVIYCLALGERIHLSHDNDFGSASQHCCMLRVDARRQLASGN